MKLIVYSDVPFMLSICSTNHHYSNKLWYISSLSSAIHIICWQPEMHCVFAKSWLDTILALYDNTGSEPARRALALYKSVWVNAFLSPSANRQSNLALTSTYLLLPLVDIALRTQACITAYPILACSSPTYLRTPFTFIKIYMAERENQNITI